MPEEQKEGKVLGICPSCKKKYREKDMGKDDGCITCQFIMVVKNGGAPSLPVFVCLRCGTLWFGNQALAQIITNIKSKQNKIIVPNQSILGARKIANA